MPGYRDLTTEDWGTDEKVKALVIPGHVPARTALAAVSHQARKWGMPGLRYDGIQVAVINGTPEHIFLEPCAKAHKDGFANDGPHDHFHRTPGPGRRPFTAVWVDG